MFDSLFGKGFTHKMTFGYFGEPAPVADAQGKAPVADAQGKALALDSVGDLPEQKATEPSNPEQLPEQVPGKGLPAAVVGNAAQDLKSSQGGGGRRRRHGSRGSRGIRRSRSKSKRGGFEPGAITHQAMGFGRAGGSGHRRSKKRNRHKRRK